MRNVLIIALLLISVPVISQNMEITWQNCFGGSEQDYVMDIVTTDNGCIIVGNTFSDDGDVSYNHGEDNDVWLVRIDSIGNLLWEKTLGGSLSDGGSRIIRASANTYYILAGALSDDYDISFDPYENSVDFWILKIDEMGNIIWDRIVGTTHYDHIYTGTITNDGGIIAIGWAGINDGDKSVWYGYYDMWMIKLNSEGEIEWDFTLGGSDFDFSHAIIQTSDGGYLVGGTAIVEPGGNLECDMHDQADAVLVKLDSARNIEWQRCYGGSDYDGAIRLLELGDGYIFSGYAGSNDGDITGWHGGNDIWVVKIDFYGNIIWQKCLGGSKGEGVKSIFSLSDGGFMIFGNTSSHDGDVIGNHSLPASGDYDIWAVKLSCNGELLWQQCFGGTRNEVLDFGVIQKDDGHYVIAGRTDNATDDVQCELHGFNEDYWAFEIKDCSQYMPQTPNQPAGPDTLCYTTDSTSVYSINTATGAWGYEWKIEPENAGTLLQDTLSAYVIWNQQYEGEVAISVRSYNDCGNSDWSAEKTTWVYNCVGIEEFQNKNIIITIYPNPADDYVVFKIPPSIPQNGGKNIILINDVFGQLIATLSIENQKLVWDTREVKAGVYFFRYKMNGVWGSGKIVISK
jgi:hypothetical protein